jgi:hypothetical protein
MTFLFEGNTGRGVRVHGCVLMLAAPLALW